MSARFIIRFDDLCPTMNWVVWDQIETILARYNVSPILAVVPENRDPYLMVAEPNPNFWNRVRDWQSKGWTIGLHGWQHCYTTFDAGLIGIKAHSEFAGLPLEVQEEKIRNGLNVFEAQNVRADIWVAPGHSFDQNTLLALKKNDIHVVSDGYFLKPVNRYGMIWLPQQLWRFRNKPFGIWTVCYHHNAWGQQELAEFEKDIRSFQTRIISTSAGITDSHSYAWTDRLLSRSYLLTLQSLRFLSSVKAALASH